MVLDVEHKEPAAAVDHRLFFFREVPFYGKQHSGNGLAVFGHLLVVVFVEVGDPEEVGQQRASLEDERVVGQTLPGARFLVVFVVDVADYLFENILESDNSAGSAEFVDDNGYMYAALAEVL